MRLADPLLAASLAAATAVGATAAGLAAAPAGALVVKASPVARPCVAAAATAFGKAGAAVVITADIGSVDSARDADVVVAAQEELTRVVEGGATVADVEADLGKIPWVLVAPSGAAAPEVGALARSSAVVRVPRGVISRHARASLEGVAPERVRGVRAEAAAIAPGAGELALVPLSLAGKGAATATSVPPILVQAVVVRASARGDAARAFVEYLASGPGNDAFRACGRAAAR